ncbi:cob(I)yrinic acid a,c-diamide adenosyltransferase [Luteolibacter sp. SL250]|uniref:cob(I)yrinic acid a,c-diamide adenosyltransferase n=1 Tax=Luteolibacter sp. SL250 TaxID=2995170 RepID=UPI00226FE710|nr:cob(I)yrinic acid a,c-diamide adenosyltransferase [Luteolibacter sp. SL250]WAC19755.1 cob(I)yrinic acid a,c-diamide adenosyltransferase [Luteolibacter sp. SL250]
MSGSIITGRGDSGETDLLFGRRIGKSSQRVAVLGCVDELNAALGLARAAAHDEEIIRLIDGVQAQLVGLMGELACVPEDVPRYAERFKGALTMEDALRIEESAKAFEARGIRFTGWARPGAEGSMMKAGLDFARTIARRTERETWILHESGEPVGEAIRLYFNRLSDLLWILARAAGDDA